jgi:hypothetical protein
MAKGIETLAGPVSENDIIMRENEAPVGAAALMNKQVRKNTPGFYKLPSQDKDMPGFMKAAQAGIKQEMAKGDTINNMAGALIRQGVDIQGMNQDQIIMLYEQMMGSTGDRDQFGITDATKILNSIAPEGEQLAYINPEEAGILAMLGGSGDMTPQGIPSFDKEEDENMGMGYGSSSSSSSSSSQDNFDGAKGGYIAGSNTIVGGDSPFKSGSSEDKGFKAAQDEQAYQTVASGGDVGNYNFYSDTVEQQADKAKDFRDKTGETITAYDYAATPLKSTIDPKKFTKDVILSDDPMSMLKGDNRTKKILELIENYEPLDLQLDGLGFGAIMNALNQGQTFKKKKDRLKRLDEDGNPIDDEYTQEGLMEEIGKIPGGRDTFFNLIKRYDPENFYKVTGMPQTSGGLEDMSKVQMLSTSGIDRTTEEGKKRYDEIKRFNAKIMEAREATQKGKGDRPQGGGGVAPPVAPPDTTPDPDDDAYKFNVGGTMPYKDDVYTGGQEMDVPVGRRFALDKTGQLQTSSPTPEDMMQYATTGAYSQLEPFSNYIKRRRKFLGEEEPEYFDEEGNIIYSGVA